MKSALMDAGLLILILVGTAGAEGTAQLSDQLQRIPQSFNLRSTASAPTNAIKVQAVSTKETLKAPATFQPRYPVPVTDRSEVRVSTFRPAYSDAESQSHVDRTPLSIVTSESKESTSDRVGTSSSVQFSPPITYGTPRPVIRSASAQTANTQPVSTTTYAPVVEIPNDGTTSPPIYSPAPSPVPSASSSTYYAPTPTPKLEPSYSVPATSIPAATVQVPTATTVVPSYAYRPAATWVSMPKTLYVGRGIIGQPTVYVPKQPVRNFFRFLSP